MNLKPLLKTASVFLMALFVTASTAKAQSWLPVGFGLPNNLGYYQGLATASENGTLYVGCTYGIGSPQVLKTEIYKWEGLFWQSLIFDSPNFIIKDIKVLNGDLYLAGPSQGQASNAAIHKYDGTSWSSYKPSGMLGSVEHIELANGNILVSGPFVSTLGSDILSFNGVTFGYMGIPPLSTYDASDVFIYNNDTLAIALVSPLADQIIKYQNGNWIPLCNYASDTIPNFAWDLKLFEFQNKLYAYERTNWAGRRLFVVKNDSLNLVGTVSHGINDVAVLNNSVYFVGDSITSYICNVSKFDGNIIVPLIGTPNELRKAQVAGNELFVFSTYIKTYNGIAYNNAFKFDDNYAILKGNIFSDLDNNCQKDSGELNLPNVIISITGGISAISDSKGNYAVGVPPGSYQIGVIKPVIIPFKNYAFNCPWPSQLNLGPREIRNLNVPFEIKPVTDATVVLTANRGFQARYGFTEKYKAEVYNTGETAFQNVELKVQIPTTVGNVYTYPPYTSLSGNILKFSGLNLPRGSSKTFEIEVIIDTANHKVGDVINWTADIMNITGDADTTDNSDTLRQVIVGAVDPNDKQTNAPFILPSTKKIDYHIRFQNTGTDTAFKVVVVDTLDVSLALTNVVINSASHPYNFSVVNNILVWEFDNILLPDSGANFLGSQGYVNFSTGINPALGLGDSVTNDADIYFDFQKPVITNMAKTTIVNNISVLEQSLPERVLEVYPNPARDIIRIKNTSAEDLEVQITNTSGQVISSFGLKIDEEMNYECSNLPAGMYILSTQFESYKILITD